MASEEWRVTKLIYSYKIYKGWKIPPLDPTKVVCLKTYFGTSPSSEEVSYGPRVDGDIHIPEKPEYLIQKVNTLGYFPGGWAPPREGSVEYITSEIFSVYPRCIFMLETYELFTPNLPSGYRKVTDWYASLLNKSDVVELSPSKCLNSTTKWRYRIKEEGESWIELDALGVFGNEKLTSELEGVLSKNLKT